jgi:hypothetical protein
MVVSVERVVLLSTPLSGVSVGGRSGDGEDGFFSF